jgi:hypothetical protein
MRYETPLGDEHGDRSQHSAGTDPRDEHVTSTGMTFGVMADLTRLFLCVAYRQSSMI